MNENNYTPDSQPGNQPEDTGHFSEPITPLIIDDNIRIFLRETVKWGKFLAIVGFVFTGIVGLVGLGIMLGGSAVTSKMSLGNNVSAGVFGFIYLLMGLLYYFPSKYLYDFSVYIKQALEINDQESLAYGFSGLKSMFKFWGILIICMLAFYALVLISVAGMVFYKMP